MVTTLFKLFDEHLRRLFDVTRGNTSDSSRMFPWRRLLIQLEATVVSSCYHEALPRLWESSRNLKCNSSWLQYSLHWMRMLLIVR